MPPALMPSSASIDRALDMLEDWCKHCGAEQEIWFLHDADLDPVRDHPRYPAVLERVDVKERAAAQPRGTR